MKINSLQLEAFFAVAKLRHFTQAAESLHVTQSALSQRIAKLEEELEVALFVRQRNSVRLTESGERLLRYCQVHESLESDLLDGFTSEGEELSGVLRVAGFSSVNRSLVLPALQSLLRENPKLSLEFITAEVHKLEDLLKSAKVDYVFTIEESRLSEVESLHIGSEVNVLVKSKKYPETQIYLDHDEHDLFTKQYFIKNKIPFKPRNRRFMGNVYDLIEGVRGGFGEAVLPLHLIKKEKDLEMIYPSKKIIVPVYLQFYTQPYYKKIHSLFLQAVTDYFAKSLNR